MTTGADAEPSLEEFDALVRHNGSVCWYTTVDQKLSAEDMAKLDAALARGYAATVIGRWLTAHGVKMDSGTVNRHRNRECQCPK